MTLLHFTAVKTEARANSLTAQLLKSLNVEPPCDPAIPLQGTHSREIKTYVHTKTCTQTCTAGLFTTAKMWKQPKRPSADEWINQMCSIHTMEWYLVIKRNEVLAPAMTWMKLEDIMLNEIRPRRINTVWSHAYEPSRTSKSMEVESSGCPGLG